MKRIGVVSIMIFFGLSLTLPSHAEVIARKESTRYHQQTCNFLMYIPESERRSFATPEEAKAAGHKYAHADCHR